MFNKLLAIWVQGIIWSNHGEGLPVDENNKNSWIFNTSNQPPFCKEKSPYEIKNVFTVMDIIYDKLNWFQSFSILKLRPFFLLTKSWDR